MSRLVAFWEQFRQGLCDETMRRNNVPFRRKEFRFRLVVSNPPQCMTDQAGALQIDQTRIKGGVLRRMNVRVFFFLHKPSRTLVVLGAIKKENDGPTPIGDKLTMRRRKRLYLEKYHSSS